MGEVTTTACPKVNCAPLASGNKSVGLFSELHYRFNGAMSPERTATDITLDGKKTLTYTATSYKSFDEITETKSCFTTISDADFQKIVGQAATANLISYAPPALDSGECEIPIGVQTTEIAYTQTDGKTNTFATFDTCMSSEVKTLTNELTTMVNNNLPCANSDINTGA